MALAGETNGTVDKGFRFVFRSTCSSGETTLRSLLSKYSTPSEPCQEVFNEFGLQFF